MGELWRRSSVCDKDPHITCIINICNLFAGSLMNYITSMHQALLSFIQDSKIETNILRKTHAKKDCTK